ncbi:pyridoxal-dependent decarboxylase, pyridoxal binding domain protein, partial [Acinetobacter sp. 983759]
MSFTRINGVLHAEQCSLKQLAQQFGTPLYVYSKQAFEKHYTDMDRAFDFIDHQICFAVKSNSNLAVLGVLAKLGAGFDIVTGGELARVLAVGGDPAKVVFSGLGKTEADIEKALNVGIACFNVESHAELDRIQKVAEKLGQKAPVSLRVNPDVDAKTHPYISTGLKENKFGIPSDSVFETYQYA